jgi:phosphoglycerate dehydrogenase-like enzyme
VTPALVRRSPETNSHGQTEGGLFFGAVVPSIETPKGPPLASPAARGVPAAAPPQNVNASPLILLDPHPRPVNLIFDPRSRERLEALGRVIWHDGSPAPAAHIERFLPEAVAIIGQTELGRERLDRAPNLKVVFNVESNFLPNVDYAECHRRGIPVLSTAPVFAKPVAEMALAMALSLARRVHQADASIRAGTETLYGEGDNHDSILLQGRPLALVGCGNVGRALLPLLRPFSSEILVCDPWIPPAVLEELHVAPASLDECFSRAAVVFLLAAVTTENAGRIGRPQFERMTAGGIVVLASRAGIVNFDELLDAAASGRIRAGIDVWPEEPIPAGHRARRTPNTLLQAHRAGNIPEIWPWMGQMVVDDLESILRGLPPQRCQRAVLETVLKLRSKPVG